MPDGLDAVIAMLGVIKSGHVYVPVDPTWPEHYRAQLLNDIQAGVLFGTTACQPIDSTIHSLTMEQALAEEITEKLPEPSPEDPACVYFTSGSTGQARGIVLHHRCLMNAARTYIVNMDVTPDDRLAWTNPVTVGASLLPIMSALLSGASLHRIEVRQEGFPRFAVWLRDQRITIWPSVASLFRSFTEELPPGPNLPDLRIVKLGGEPVHATDVVLFEQRFHAGCILMNGLGITECGGNICWHRHVRGTKIETSTLPVGRAVDGMVLSLRHNHDHPADAGEIVVRSAYLALGYWNSVAGRIDSFSPPDAQGCVEFHTRDLARMDAHGNFVHLGRTDDVLNVHGHRIERTQIEAALLALPWIMDAAVGTRDVAGVGQLVAHIVWRDARAPEIAEVRTALMKSLPAFMIPSRFLTRPSLPRMKSGKLDRRQLDRVDAEEATPELIPVSDPLERQLIVLWKKALGRNHLSVTDDFFNVGGDSLSAVRLFALLDQRLGVNLPLVTLSHHRTVRALAEHIRANGATAARSCAHLLQAGDHRTPLFCLPGAGSDCMALLELALSLDPRQTVYAMQYAGLADGETYHNRIPEMAAYFLKEVRRIQPRGPYALAGTSFGGWVAFEMARQLTASGERVATLALLDTFGPGYLDPQPNPTLRRRALLTLRWWLPLANKDELSLANLLAGLREKCERWMARTLRFFRPRRILPLKLRYLHLQDQCFAAGKSYQPEPYSGGAIHLFRAEIQPPVELFHITPDMGWTSLAAGGLRIHDVPGRHGLHIRQPHVQVLAQKLQECLPGLIAVEAGRFVELRDHSRERWDALAAWWDAQSGDDGHADTRDLLLPLCLHLLKPAPGEHLIDAGCGNGWIARRLAHAGASVVAFDFSAELLERGRRRDPTGSVVYRHIDATMPDQLAVLGHHTADGAICYMALMDIADITPLMESLRRAIRPGGRFVFAMIHPESAGLTKASESQALTNLGKPNQPVEHYYFHRPLPLLLSVFEQTGWQLDQLSSPSSPTGARFLVGRLIAG